MFAKDKVPQSLVDAVSKILATESKKSDPEQLNEAFPTVADAKKRMNEPKPSGGAGIKLGTRYGGGRQADEPEKDEDEPKKREKYGARKTRFTNTKLYKEADDCVDKDDAKDIAKKEVDKHEGGMHGKKGEVAKHEKSMHKEELKGNQHKIDANKNGKIDSQDFEILRSKKKKMTEGLAFAEHLIESMYGKKSALPIDEKEMSDAQKKKREDIVMSMKKDTAGLKKRYGSRWKDVMYATATKQAMKQETYGEEVEIDEAKKPMTQDEKDRVTAGLRAAMKKSYDNEMKGRAALETAKAVAKAMASAHKAKKTNEEVEEFEEEIDPNVRTKDALSGGNKPTKQKDDTGPGSDGRSTKVKFRGGPMDEEKENEKEDEGHEDEKEDKALVKKMVKKDALKEDEQLDEISKKTVKSYLSKTVDPVYGIPKSKEKLSQRMKGISAAHQRVVGNKPTSEEVEIEEGMQQTLRKYVPGYAKNQLNKKMDAQKYAPGDSIKKTVDKDVNYGRYKKVYDKLNKEEVEQIDELSHGTLRSYVDKAKAENLPGKGGNRGVALLTPGTRDKGVHKAVDKMKKMKANEEVELDETSHMNKPKSLKSFMAMKKEMIGKAGMTSEKKDED